jgi:hypothetical protein
MTAERSADATAADMVTTGRIIRPYPAFSFNHPPATIKQIFNMNGLLFLDPCAAQHFHSHME